MRVRIYKPAKNAMQSGRAKTKRWILEYRAETARIPEPRRKRALRAALVVAHADGLAPEEERMFRDAATALGLTAAEADELLAEVRRESTRPHRIS